MASLHEIFQRIPKILGLHIIRVTSEALVPPSHIHRIRPTFPPSSQRRHMPILEPSFPETLCKSLLVELRITPGKRNGPDVGQDLNAVRQEEPEEFFNGAC